MKSKHLATCLLLSMFVCCIRSFCHCFHIIFGLQHGNMRRQINGFKSLNPAQFLVTAISPLLTCKGYIEFLDIPKSGIPLIKQHPLLSPKSSWRARFLQNHLSSSRRPPFSLLSMCHTSFTPSALLPSQLPQLYTTKVEVGEPV